MDPETIKREALTHFHRLLMDIQDEDEDCNRYVPQEIPPLVTLTKNIALESTIWEQKVKDVIWELEQDKDLGPDGFHISFYRLCWNTIKKGLCTVVSWSLEKQKMGGNTKSSFLSLIPKEANPTTLSCFKFICICNASYKVIMKIIATRLKNLHPKIIFENEASFVQDFQILDNVILVQEAIHSSKVKNEQGMAIEIDITNAFDYVKSPSWKRS